MDIETNSDSAGGSKEGEGAVVSTTEAAKQLGVSVRTVQLWVENGRLVAWKTAGNHRRIFQWSIDQYREQEGQLVTRSVSGLTDKPSESTILIIEDDRTTQVYYETMLTLLNYADNVEFAGDGIEGMVAIGKYEPWLIVLDIDMPRLDGIEVVNMLERQKIVSKTALLVISNVSHEDALLRGLPESCAFFSKPVSLEDFKLAVSAKRELAKTEHGSNRALIPEQQVDDSE